MVGHDVVHCTYSVGLDHGVNVIQVGQEELSWVELLLDGLQCRLLPQGKQRRHEGIPLLSALCLFYDVVAAVVIMPNIL